MNACVAAAPGHGHCDEATGVTGHESWWNLFNQRTYHELNVVPGQNIVALYANDDAGRPLGGLTGVLTDGTIVSGYSAPFGGIDLVRAHETPENVETVVQAASRQVRDAGARTLRIRLAPACYSPNQPLVLCALLNAGFTVARCEYNQHIDLSTVATAEDWAAALHRPARRGLRALLTGDFTFGECRTDDEWVRAYQLLADNRARKGRALSISSEYVHRARVALPGRLRMSELRHQDSPVAAALTYDVAPGCRLVVAWGDADHGLPDGPMRLLAYRLVEAALADRMRVLDLGVSNLPMPRAEGGLALDPGLAQFKRSVLARIEPRLTVERSWDS